MLTGRLDMHDTGILGFLYLEERFLARSLAIMILCEDWSFLSIFQITSELRPEFLSFRFFFSSLISIFICCDHSVLNTSSENL